MPIRGMDSAGSLYARTSLLEPRVKKAHGVFYTPSALAEFIVKHTLGAALKGSSLERARKLRILDPTCGTGVFLETALKFLCAWYGERLGRELTSRERERVARTQLFGVDLDAEAAGMARERLTPNIRCANVLTNFVWDDGFGEPFDVVIGNPPYGAQTGGSSHATNTAALVVRLARVHTRWGGYDGFVVPKSFAYASNWRELRGELHDELTLLADVGCAWADVKLEQVIYISHKGESVASYDSYLVREERLCRVGRVRKSDCEAFGFLVNGVTADELALGLKIRAAGTFLGQLVTNVRGASLQSRLCERGKLRVLGGKQIQPFCLEGAKGYLDAKAPVPENARVKAGSLLVQNIVAHVTTPAAHLKITAAVAGARESRECLILDTVNQLENRSNIPSAALAILIQSRLVNWYVYRFIVGRAVRTIHFDAPVTDRIPVPKNFKLGTEAIEVEICRQYGLSRREIALLHDAE